MQIFRTLAGYSYGRADIVRRAMAKKKAAVLENERKAFIYGEKGQCCGAVANGVPANVANEIFDEMTSLQAMPLTNPMRRLMQLSHIRQRI